MMRSSHGVRPGVPSFAACVCVCVCAALVLMTSALAFPTGPVTQLHEAVHVWLALDSTDVGAADAWHVSPARCVCGTCVAGLTSACGTPLAGAHSGQRRNCLQSA